MDKWMPFLAAALSVLMARAEPDPGKEIAVGQKFAETRAVLKQHRMALMAEYPFAIFDLGTSEHYAVELDDGIILSLDVDPLHESVAGISATYTPSGGTKVDRTWKNAAKVVFNSEESYSIEFKRATAGTDEKIVARSEEISRKLRERDEAATARAAPESKAPKVDCLETEQKFLDLWNERAARVVFGSNPTIPFDPRREAVASTSDKAVIGALISSVVGRQIVAVDSQLRRPVLPLVVLDRDGVIIGVFVLDRTPQDNGHGTRAVVRWADCEWDGDKILVRRVSLTHGYPCKALEPFCMDELDVPPLRPLEDGKDLPVLTPKQTPPSK